MHGIESAVQALCEAICRLLAPHPMVLELPALQRAYVALLLVAPLAAMIGTQVINFRFAFFAEAVGHSAYTGIAFGLLASILLSGPVDPVLGMTAFGLIVAVAITAYRRSTGLASDTVIGVFSSAVIALGLVVITYLVQRRMIWTGDSFSRFLTGTVLLTSVWDLIVLVGLAVGILIFEIVAYNRLLLVALDTSLAGSRRIRVAFHEYVFALLLALVVMCSIRVIGALLVTAMLVVPAAAARNLARSAGALFWWGIVIALSSAIAGFWLSLVLRTATGASIVLVAVAWFIVSQAVSASRRGR